MKLKKERAACFQLNLLAVVGYYGLEITKIARQLLAKILLVGSDVHHNKHIAAFEQKVNERFGAFKRRR
jgi:tyrosine-protein phosphatase YwqE